MSFLYFRVPELFFSLSSGKSLTTSLFYKKNFLDLTQSVAFITVTKDYHVVSADYIYGEENKLQVQRDKLVTRYISAPEFGHYSANCYKSEGNRYILVMRRKQEFIISFKGIDCSARQGQTPTSDQDPTFYFAPSSADPWIYTVGISFKESNQNGRLWELDTPWCIYEVNVRYPSNTKIEPAFTNNYLTNIQWTEVSKTR